MLLFVDLTRFMLALLIFTQYIYIYFFVVLFVTSYMFICPYQTGCNNLFITIEIALPIVSAFSHITFRNTSLWSPDSCRQTTTK